MGIMAFSRNNSIHLGACEGRDCSAMEKSKQCNPKVRILGRVGLSAGKAEQLYNPHGMFR